MAVEQIKASNNHGNKAVLQYFDVLKNKQTKNKTKQLYISFSGINWIRAKQPRPGVTTFFMWKLPEKKVTAASTAELTEPKQSHSVCVCNGLNSVHFLMFSEDFSVVLTRPVFPVI